MQSSEGDLEEVASECAYEQEDGEEDREDTSHIWYHIDNVVEPSVNVLGDGTSLYPEICGLLIVGDSPSVFLCGGVSVAGDGLGTWEGSETGIGFYNNFVDVGAIPDPMVVCCNLDIVSGYTELNGLLSVYIDYALLLVDDEFTTDSLPARWRAFAFDWDGFISASNVKDTSYLEGLTYDGAEEYIDFTIGSSETLEVVSDGGCFGEVLGCTRY